MSEDNSVWRETLASSIAKAVKAAKRLGYSGEAFSSMASISWSSYQAGESDAKADAKKSSEEKKS